MLVGRIAAHALPKEVPLALSPTTGGAGFARVASTPLTLATTSIEQSSWTRDRGRDRTRISLTETLRWRGELGESRIYPGFVTADGTGRRRRPPPLLIELAAIVVVLTAAAFGVYYGFRPAPVHNVLALGGANVPVANLADQQWEPSVAVDPTNPRALVAASADGAVDVRVYDSRNGGASWTSEPAPPRNRASCGLGHPAVDAGPRCASRSAATPRRSVPTCGSTTPT